jgi:hypothetical protein
MRTLVLACALATGCASTIHGSVTPSLDICNLGTFDQQLVIGPDFHIDRFGDDRYDSDSEVRQALAVDVETVKHRGICPGKHKMGTFTMTLRRIEVGSSRSMVGKLATWIVLILPTLGLSSIYPLTEARWLTVEMDAAAVVDGKQVWTGQFSSHSNYRLVQRELPSSGFVIGAMMKRAQAAAISDLVAAKRTETRIE